MVGMTARLSRTALVYSGLAGLIVGLVFAMNAVDCFKPLSLDFSTGPKREPEPPEVVVTLFGDTVWRREAADETVRQGWVLYSVMVASISLAGAGIAVAVLLLSSPWKHQALKRCSVIAACWTAVWIVLGFWPKHKFQLVIEIYTWNLEASHFQRHFGGDHSTLMIHAIDATVYTLPILAVIWACAR